MLKLATWNVNSLRVRLEQVLQWLQTSATDVLLLQETKCVDEFFPRQAFEDRGFYTAYIGQKTYNGVAIISKHPIEDIQKDIPNLDNEQKRTICATILGIRFINLYVPNGFAVDSQKYKFKLNWLEIVHNFLAQELQKNPELVVVGDFNIAPQAIDVYDCQKAAGKILFSSAERAAFSKLLELPLTDCYRAKHPEHEAYSWWDYRNFAFKRDSGFRIDHILLSTSLQKNCEDVDIDKKPRTWERPSDHAPVWATLNI